jgi:hypothetical protein
MSTTMKRNRVATGYEKLVDPSAAIALGQPRSRTVELATHIRELDRLADTMEATARDDERFAEELLALALRDDAEEIVSAFEHGLKIGGYSVARDLRRSQLLAFIAGMRTAAKMRMAPRVRGKKGAA